MQVFEAATLFFVLFFLVILLGFGRWVWRINKTVKRMKEINARQIKAIIGILDEVQSQLVGIKVSLKNLSVLMKEDITSASQLFDSPQTDQLKINDEEQDISNFRPPKSRKLLH